MTLTIRSLERRVKPSPLRNGHAERVPGTPARFTVAQYHIMIRAGVLTENDRVELVNGWIVHKMPIDAPHRKAVTALYDRLKPIFPKGSLVCSQNPITLAESEPEPDFVASEPPSEKYDTRHPGTGEIYLVVEVSDSSLAFDRSTKLAMYATAGIPVYWVVNLIDKQIEVYTKPKGPKYAKRADYKPGDNVPVTVAGKKRGTVAVSDVLP